MKPTRHEEYSYFNSNLPFILLADLDRTPSNLSAEKNWHENLEIQLCTDGQGEVLLDGTSYAFNKGDFVVANSNVIHYTCTNDRLVYTCLIIDTEFCRRVGIDVTQIQFVSKFRSQTLERLFDRLKKAVLERDIPYKLALSNVIVLEILIELYKNYIVKDGHVSAKRNTFENVKKAIVYIRKNFSNRITLDQISNEVLANKFVLTRDFKKITGQTIINYLNSYRCQRAAEMIESGKGVAESAYECGFENLSFFSKTFKKFMGSLPSKYKNK